MEGYPHEEGFQIRDYWRSIRKRLGMILAIFFIVVVTTMVVSLRQTPVYDATAKILIESNNPQVVNVDEVLAVDVSHMDYYRTQVKIMESETLAREVIVKMGLDKHPDFDLDAGQGTLFGVRAALASLVRTVVPKKEPTVYTSGEVDPLESCIKLYMQRLKISPIRNSRLVNVSFESTDPVLAARVANVHAKAYIDKNLELKVTASNEAVDWLNSRLGNLEQSLKKSEEALQAFQKAEDIVTLESSLSSNKENNIVAQRLAELNTNLSQAKNEASGEKALYDQLKQLEKQPGMVESIPQVIQNPLIQKLKGDYTELNREYSELKEKFGQKHPRMVALQQEIISLQKRIQAEVAKIAKSVEIKYNVALAKVRDTEAQLNQVKSEIQDLNEKAIEYGVLTREVETNRQLYNMILKRVKETSLTSGLKSTNIYVVDKAGVPKEPIRPRKVRNVFLGAIVGLMLGISLAFFFEYLDNKLHGPDEVKRYLGVPFLGPASIAPKVPKGNLSELIVFTKSRSPFAESLRTIRTNVVFSLPDEDQNAFLITSPGPLEGKTFISSNLSVSMAQMGHSVLLVDADMRRPRVHKLFGISSEPGLSNLVLGQCTLQEAVRTTQNMPFFLMPAGKIPPNPSEILASRNMQKLLAELRNKYDYVIFDTPPVLSATDSAVLSTSLDGVILVVKAAETTRDNARGALGHLQDVQARILGVILNQVDFRKESYHYSYYNKYYNYYAEDGQKKEKQSGVKLVGRKK